MMDLAGTNVGGLAKNGPVLASLVSSPKCRLQTLVLDRCAQKESFVNNKWCGFDLFLPSKSTP